MDNLSQFLALGKSKKPTKAPVENSTEPVVNDGKRCLCRTEEGKQCKHPRKNGYFCAQHKDCTNPCILMETLPEIELKEPTTDSFILDGSRCLCLIKDGTQCKRSPNDSGSGFCTMHSRKCISNVKSMSFKGEGSEAASTYSAITTPSAVLDRKLCLCIKKNGTQCTSAQDTSGTGFCDIHSKKCTRSVTSMSFKGEETAKSIISSASSISSTTKSVANQAQCQCIAESTGLQCEHDHKIGSIYCGHHQNCKKPIKPRQETVDIAKEEQDRSQIYDSVQSLKDSIVSGVSTTVGAVTDGIQSIVSDATSAVLYVDKSVNAIALQTPSIVMSMAKSIADDVKSLVITPVKSMVSGTELKIETNESTPQSPIQSEVKVKTESESESESEVKTESESESESETVFKDKFNSQQPSQSTLSRKRKTNYYRLPDAKRITRQSRINAKEQVYQCPYMNKEDQPCIFFNKNTDKVCPLHREDVV